MNIWMLTSEFPPEFGGGIGMYVDHASQMFATNGHNVTVFVRDTEKDQIEFPKENLRIVRFKHCKGEIYSKLGYWAALAYQYAEEVLNVLQEEGVKPDIIEIQEYGAIGYYLLLKKWTGDVRLKDIPIVVHLHTPVFELTRINQSPEYKFPNYWTGQMEKFCMKAADALLSPSQFLKNEIQYIAPDNSIKVINLPYMVDNVNDLPERNKESKTLLYFGRTEYRKGIYQVLGEMEKLWCEGYLIKLKIIGGDVYFHPKARNLGEIIKERYKKWIDKGLLELHRPIHPKELNYEILDAMAVIVPSIYENFPYTSTTSMWLGAPMLVSKQGGQAEMVAEDGVNGFIFDWEKNDFVDKVKELIGKTPEELHNIGEAGKNRIHKLCNVDTNIRLREEFFTQVIKDMKGKERKEFPFLNKLPKTPHNFLVEEEKELLSIIIPYYNLGGYIEETVKSAIEVSYENKEIIIVNDGSTDEKSIEALKKVKEDYKEIKVVNIANGGLSNARNVGVECAKGEYITFLDADDLIDKDFYKRGVDILKQYTNVSFVYSWVEYFDGNTGVWPTFSTELPYVLCANMLSAFCVVRKQDFINFGKNRIELEYGMEDYDCWVGMCEHGYLGVSIPETLVKYRVRGNSMSRQFNVDMRLYLSTLLSKGHKKIYNQFGTEIYNLMMANGPGYLWNNPTFELPPVGFVYSSNDNGIVHVTNEIDTSKYELMRLANSKWGARIIKLMFKLRINRIFK